MSEGRLFTVDERLTVPISQIAHPDDIHIFGDHFGDATYYADYAGIAARYGPASILEIGVRYGYSGLALGYGALRAKVGAGATIRYWGLDAECFGPGEGTGQPYRLYRSNAVAAENFARFFPNEPVQRRFFRTNTQTEPLPAAVLAGRYDLVSIDGDHSYHGARRDMALTWPLLNEGGLMLIDDAGMEDVERAAMDHIAAVEQAGEIVLWQKYPNERMMILIQKLPRRPIS